MLTLLMILTLLMAKEIKSTVGFSHARRLERGQIPYLVQFQTVSACGGVLLTPDWVLTAAQCVTDKRSAIYVNLAGSDESNAKPIGVKATYIHPDYDFYSQTPDFEHNIALLKLSGTCEFSNINKALQIGPLKLDDSYNSCVIFGWQSSVFPNSRVFAKPVQYLDILPNAWKVCTYAHGLYGTISNRDNALCAMIESDTGMKSCAGNPGSPIVCENQYGKNILLGIASWTNYSLYCNGLPTYLSVAPFSSWIYNLILSTHRSLLPNSTVNYEFETRSERLRGDLAEFRRSEQSEQFADSEDYGNFRELYEDPLKEISDDPHLFYISVSILTFDSNTIRIVIFIQICLRILNDLN